MGKIITVYGPLLLQAMGHTLLLALYGLFFACIIGMIVGIMSVLRSRICRVIAGIFVNLIRGVPMIVLAYFVYFGVPYLFNTILNMGGVTLSALQAGTICLSLNCGAYMAEIIRAGIQSIDPGQMEAARSLGLTYWRSMFRVVLPQAIRNILPALGNEFVMMIKETSLASTFFVGDLMTSYLVVKGNTYLSFECLVIVGIIYFVVTFTLSKLIGVFEKRMKANA